MAVTAGMSSSLRSWSALSQIATIIAVAAGLRVLGLFLFEGSVHDGTDRVATALAWLQQGVPFLGRTYWPEGNYLLPAIMLAVWGDPYWAPRAGYLLIGLTNIYAAWRLADLVFDRNTAVVTAWIVTLMPFHIMVSINGAMSETPYITCALVAALLMVHYFERPSVLLAIGSGLAVALATAFRYDAVMWGLPLALAQAYGAYRHEIGWYRYVRDASVFGICGLLYVAFIIATWLVLYPNDPWQVVSTSGQNTGQFLVEGEHPRFPGWLYSIYTIFFWPASLGFLLTPVVAICGFVGVLAAAQGRNLRVVVPILALVVVWLAFAWGATNHRILAQWRYSLVLAILLAMFVPLGLAWLARVRPWVTAKGLVVAALAMAVVFQLAVSTIALHGSGTVARQLRVISPFAPGQFAAHDLLEWVAADPSRQPALVTPHAGQSAYLNVHSGARNYAGMIHLQQYYMPNSDAIYLRDDLEAVMHREIENASVVVTDTSQRTSLGLRDGLSLELVQPVCPETSAATDIVCSWRSLNLKPAERFSTLQVWHVVHR